MLIQLPLEVWMDILGWLRKYRREVAIKINQIGDYQFTEIVQHWLHDYTKNLLLGQMFTTRNEDGKARLEICTGDEGPDNDQGHISVPFAQVPIPDNISDVKRIIIKFLDSNVLDFLRKLGEFFTQFVIVGQKKRLENARTAIAHLLPIFDGIDTFMFAADSAPLLFFIRDHFPSKFYAASFIKVIRVHCLQFTDDYANALLNWLSHERNHGQPPRMLLLKTCSTSASKFVEDIKKRFLAATTPTAYMVQIIAADLSTIQTSTIENVTTGERLIFQMSVELFIIRCSATASDDGFGEWIEHTRHKKQGECWLQTAKLGMIDEDLDMEEAVGQFFKLVADE